jgi:hypothetical protein
MIALMLGNMIASIISPDNPACFNIEDTTLIVYGDEIDHEYQSTTQTSINVIKSLPLNPVTDDIDITHRTIDIMLYNRNGLIGSIWFMYNEKSFTWYAQLNNGYRHDCGLYQIDTSEMMDTIRNMRG